MTAPKTKDPIAELRAVATDAAALATRAASLADLLDPPAPTDPLVRTAGTASSPVSVGADGKHDPSALLRIAGGK